MLEPIILSDEDEDPKTPLPSVSKKARTGPDPIFPTIFVLDDDPTPLKPGPNNTTVTGSASTPSFVAETPMSDLSIMFSGNDQRKLSDKGRNGVISLESENEDGEETVLVQGSKLDDAFGCADWSQISDGSSSQGAFSFDHIDEVRDHPDKENFRIEELENNVQPNAQNRPVPGKKDGTQGAVGKKKISKEERARIMEEKKLMKEQEKLQKAAMKAQDAELKKLEKEKEKWAKGKFALKSIVAEFDTKVVEQGSIGGHLLTMFADKGLKYRITSNPIERSVVWTITVPEHISQLSPEGMEIRYVLLVYEAEEFCNLLINQSFLDHVSRVRSRYPSYTVCYLTNRLMAYIHKMEKEQYKNPENDNGWRRPPIEKELAKLTTHFLRVHYRMCIDEAEVAEHVVGLTCSLATCQFRKKLTRLSVNANGSLVPKDFIDRDLIKKSPWLKALVAIPKVQPRFAIAIWKKYPTMKSLLRVYMDPNKSVHEKECLLEDLTTEGLLGGERRVGRICSKRVYRILMAQSGSIKTDDVEDGADFFEQSS